MFVSGIDDRFRVIIICRAAEAWGRAVRFVVQIRFLSAIGWAKSCVIPAKDLSAEGSSARIRDEGDCDFADFRYGRQRSMHIERRYFSDFLVNCELDDDAYCDFGNS